MTNKIKPRGKKKFDIFYIIKMFPIYFLIIFVTGILLYGLFYPLISINKETLTCDSNYICRIQKHYTLYSKYREIELDKNNSSIWLDTHYRHILTRANNYERYAVFLKITDKTKLVVSPFTREIDSYFVDHTISKTKDDIKSEQETIKKQINEKNLELQKDFNAYLNNPEKSFIIQSSADNNDKFMFYPLVIPAILFFGYIFLGGLIFNRKKQNIKQQEQ